MRLQPLTRTSDCGVRNWFGPHFDLSEADFELPFSWNQIAALQLSSIISVWARERKQNLNHVYTAMTPLDRAGHVQLVKIMFILRACATAVGRVYFATKKSAFSKFGRIVTDGPADHLTDGQHISWNRESRSKNGRFFTVLNRLYLICHLTPPNQERDGSKMSKRVLSNSSRS